MLSLVSKDWAVYFCIRRKLLNLSFKFAYDLIIKKRFFCCLGLTPKRQKYHPMRKIFIEIIKIKYSLNVHDIERG